MRVKHGVVTPFEKEAFERQEVEFWWVGEKVDQGEFNKRSIEQTRMLGQNLENMLPALNVKIETQLVEKILKGPLCEVCKLMIENMKP